MRVMLRLDGTITVGERGMSLTRIFALLDGIAREGSVSGAAQGLGVSYRSAWQGLRDLEAALGRPIAVKTKGHGTALTAFGAGLRDALADATTAMEGVLAETRDSLERRLDRLLDEPAPTLRVALSHDPLLLDILGAIPGVSPRVLGSDDAVALLLKGEIDAAGFHAHDAPRAEAGPLGQALAGGDVTVLALFRREQGFIVAPGNPLGIRGAADISRTRARYVNRQRGSGTRRWFDRLLGEAGLAPAAIEGYGTEEFTHQAVAALIAAGAAQAGMGLAWVAERFGLGFVPVGWETFHLAGTPEAMARLAGPILREVERRLPNSAGYAPPAGAASPAAGSGRRGGAPAIAAGR
ncbi:substrate-binding domain-containing protein [Salinarimonas soli]|nr:substrate-binding domain-containing protein [Salinarimonas soli]